MEISHVNIILFSLDTVRADHLSCYGYPRLTSPHLDRVAQQGAMLLDFYSPHIPTYPGHTTMMTGRDVYAHHVTGQSTAFEPTPGIPMLAEILRQDGYRTYAADTLGRWFARGFDVYEGYEWSKEEPRHWRAGEAVTSVALNLLDRAVTEGGPFFMFVHYWDAHTPYYPPPPFDRAFYARDERDPANRSMDAVWDCEAFKWYFHEWMPGVTDIEFPKAQYDAEIAYMDACVGHLLNRVQELGIEEDTLLVFTADHGEELDEHGCWFDHHGLYETNTHIPLLLRLPGVIPAGLRVPGMAAMMDLAPTILDYAGVRPDRLTFDGASLRGRLDGKSDGASAQPRRVLHMTENTWMKKRAVRTQEWKLIRALEPDIHGLPPVELYRLSDDPKERVNLADAMPEVVAELTACMEAHVAARTRDTGLTDPLPVQPTPLKRIGHAEETQEEKRNTLTAHDEKLEDGDFVGYVREDR